MKTLKELAYQIEINRQRLHHATATDNTSLMWSTMKRLSTLHAEYFNESKKGLNMKQVNDRLLVFSEAHPDGAVLTRVEYRALCLKMDRFDRDTHTAVPIAIETAEIVEQQVFELTGKTTKAS